jgi:zinc/manganese transport system substrate-binding protein
VQPGQPGNFAAADHVRKLEVPALLDRSQGDVHTAGNPHIQTDPRNIAAIATALGTRLQEVDAANAGQYARRQADFSRRWQQAINRWTAQAAPLKGIPVVSQHKGFVYLYDWLGMKEVAVLEPKPGIEPTVSHLQRVLATLKSAPARMVLYSAYQDPRPSEWLSTNARIPAVRIPYTVGGSEAAKDLFSLFDDTVARLLAAGTKP